MRSILILLLFLALAGSAAAVDGVLEINDACAKVTGCFESDTPGYPVTIDNSVGLSYRLTGDLAVGIANPNTDGLVLESPGITIDFNGFALFGAQVGLGTGRGVIGASASFATIKNGRIRGFRGRGIDLGGVNGVQVENMILEGNEGGGIQVGDDAQIVRSRVSNNGSTTEDGIVTGLNSRISENVVTGSGGSGIFGGDGSLISKNVASGNLVAGIIARDGSTVSSNTALQNGGAGIIVNPGSTVSGNTVRLNGGDGISTSTHANVSGNTAYANGGDGIDASSNSLVQRNLVGANGEYGLNLTGQPPAAYRENVIHNNTTAAVLDGVNLGDNHCYGFGVVSASCP